MPAVSETMPVTLDAAEKVPILSGRSAYFSSWVAQLVEVHSPVDVLVDDHHVGDGLPPRDLVGVVLVGPEEHHRSLGRRDVVGEVMGVVEGRRDPEPEHPDQLRDRAGAAGPREEHHRVVARADRLADDLPGLLAQPRGLQAGAAGLGVGVGVAGQHLVADEVLDERQRPPARRVVGVRHPPHAVRRLHQLVVTDHGVADQPQQGFGVMPSHGLTIRRHAAVRTRPRPPGSPGPYRTPRAPGRSLPGAPRSR